MRNLIATTFLLFGFALAGCYKSHGRTPILAMGDAGPGPVSDAGWVMPEPDAGPVMMADAGSDVGSDAGIADAFIPFDGDAGEGRIAVRTTRDYSLNARPAIAQPGYRNRMDERELCNSADEDVLFSSLDQQYAPLPGRVQNITIESGGTVLGRLEGSPTSDRATVTLDTPLRIPAHGCVTFKVMAEVANLVSWAEEPAEAGATHSGDVATIVWMGGCTDADFCFYVGEARGEMSGMPYAFVEADDFSYTVGGLYHPVRASAVVFNAEDAEQTVHNPNDVTVLAFEARAIGATAGFLRGSVIVNTTVRDDIADAWFVMNGRRLTDRDVRIDPIWFGDFYGTVYLFTLREERVLEVAPGRVDSDPVRLEMHISLAYPEGSRWISGRLINPGLAGISHDLFGEPITGTLADVTRSYELVGGTATFPGPAITRSFGPYAGETESAIWLVSDHSEPDHSLASRDWTDGFMLVEPFSTWDTIYVP